MKNITLTRWIAGQMTGNGWKSGNGIRKYPFFFPSSNRLRNQMRSSRGRGNFEGRWFYWFLWASTVRSLSEAQCRIQNDFHTYSSRAIWSESKIRGSGMVWFISREIWYTRLVHCGCTFTPKIYAFGISFFFLQENEDWYLKHTQNWDRPRHLLVGGPKRKSQEGQVDIWIYLEVRFARWFPLWNHLEYIFRNSRKLCEPQQLVRVGLGNTM